MMAPPAKRRATDNGLRQRLVGGGAQAIVIKGCAVALSYGFLLLLARLVDAEAYGRYGFAMSLAGLFGVLAAAGQPSAILRFRPMYLVLGEPERAARLLRLGYLTVLGCGVLSGLALLATATLLGQLGAMPDALRPGSSLGGALLYPTALLVLALGLAAFQSAALRAQGRILAALVPGDVVYRCGLLLVLAVPAYLGRSVSPANVLWTGCILWVLVLAPQAFLVWQGGGHGMRRRVETRELPGWRAASAVFLAVGLMDVLRDNADMLVLGLLHEAAETGRYFAALKIASLFLISYGALNFAAAPVISRAYHSNDLAKVQDVCRTLAAASALPALLGLAVVGVMGDRILALFGPRFAEVQPILIVLVLGSVASILAGPSALIVTMAKGEAVFLRTLIAIRVLTIPLQALFLTLLGPIGVACASAAANLAIGIWAWHFVRRNLGIESSVACLLPDRLSAPKAGVVDAEGADTSPASGVKGSGKDK